MKNAGTADSLSKDGSAARVSLFAGLKITSICLDFERQAHLEGYSHVAGLDEVGRGCLAGPVVAAACVLDPNKRLPKGLNDSKKLTPALREEIAAQLREDCVGYAIGRVEPDEIDEINILEATKRAMCLALTALRPAADYLLIDALRLKEVDLPQKAIIKGDSISASIAAASILAKTHRDALMCDYHNDFPQYGFADHKGYAAAIHLEALREHGPCAIHRRSFHGVLPPVETTAPLFVDIALESGV